MPKPGRENDLVDIGNEVHLLRILEVLPKPRVLRAVDQLGFTHPLRHLMDLVDQILLLWRKFSAIFAGGILTIRNLPDLPLVLEFVKRGCDSS